MQKHLHYELKHLQFFHWKKHLLTPIAWPVVWLMFQDPLEHLQLQQRYSWSNSRRRWPPLLLFLVVPISSRLTGKTRRVSQLGAKRTRHLWRNSPEFKFRTKYLLKIFIHLIHVRQDDLWFVYITSSQVIFRNVYVGTTLAAIGKNEDFYSSL